MKNFSIIITSLWTVLQGVFGVQKVDNNDHSTPQERPVFIANAASTTDQKVSNAISQHNNTITYDFVNDTLYNAVRVLKTAQEVAREQVQQQKMQESFDLFLDKNFLGFKEALGFKESSGRYHIVNQFGYLGKYQFSLSTLRVLGLRSYATKNLFLKSSALQESAFKAHTARNKWILKRDIKRFCGKRINGIRVTESGILAAAHLVGAGAVKIYLRSYGKERFSDANGTTIRYYMKRFSGYDLSEIQPERLPRLHYHYKNFGEETRRVFQSSKT